MSDEKSLEDFFAKKDKSKKNKSKAKGKTKFTTTDEIAKNLVRDVEVKKAAAKQERESREKKDKEKKAAAAAAAAAAEQTTTEAGEEKPNNKAAFPIGEAEEWNEFEDPSQKDYSGLKVQSLQISAEPEEVAEEDDEGEVEYDENGDMVKKKESGASGPWNKSGGTTVQTVSPSEPEPPAPKIEVKPEALKNVTGGKYVPPSRRGGAPSSESSTPSRMNRHNKGSKNAPSIQSDLEFPSLAASSDIAKYSDKNDDKNYREVRRGGQATDNPGGHKPGLELGNRYSALGN